MTDTDLMDKPKRKKLYYVPGIISLTLLPIAFIYFAKTKIRENDVRVIQCALADTNIINKQNSVFSKFNGHFPPIRNYTDITFTGNEIYNNIKLEFAQVRIKEILTKSDTINGLHFIFNNSSHYGTFVKTIGTLQFEGAKTYMPLDNNLWFYYFQPDTIIKPLNDSICCVNDVIYIEPKISWWTKAKKKAIQIWNSSWEIILVFSGFIFSIIVFRRRNNGS